MANIAPYVFWQSFDNSGDPLAGGKIYTYEAGTSTPKVTYTDSGEGTANANPVILDANGRADIWLGDGSYKFVIYDSSDVLIDTVDNVVGEAANAFGGTYRTVTTNTSVTADYANNVLECTSAVTLSLLDVATATEGFLFTVKNTSGGSVIIDPDAAELIDGASTLTIPDDTSALIVCTGTAWTSLFYNNILPNDNTFTGANTFSGDVSMSSSMMRWAKGADVASASALPILTDGNYFDVTGTTAITSINTSGQVGTVIKLQFDGALTLTHHATDLILPGGANITTAAGDEAEFVEYASGDWRCTNYSKASGEPVAGVYTSQMLYVRREETSGTVGGTATTGSLQTLTLNTVVTNEITGASLGSNLITLPAGTYRINARSPFYRTNAAYIQIYNSSDTTEIEQGSNIYSSSSSGDMEWAHAFAVFTLASSKDIAIRYRCTTTTGTSDLGNAKSYLGVVEVYTEVIIEKVATS